MLSWFRNKSPTDNNTASASGSANDEYGEQVNDGGRPVRIQCYEGDMEYNLDGPVSGSHGYSSESSSHFNNNNNCINSNNDIAVGSDGNMEVTFDKSRNNRQDNEEGFSRRSKLICVGVCLVLVLGAIIATPVALTQRSSDTETAAATGADGNEDDDPNDGPTDTPTMAPTFTERFGEFYDLVSIIPSDALDDEESGQFQALKWLVYDDEANVTLDTTSATHAVERYVVASLYFATGGNSWLQLNDVFLSQDSICDWNDSADLGVFCDGNGFVNRISIGT